MLRATKSPEWRLTLLHTRGQSRNEKHSNKPSDPKQPASPLPEFGEISFLLPTTRVLECRKRGILVFAQRLLGYHGGKLRFVLAPPKYHNRAWKRGRAPFLSESLEVESSTQEPNFCRPHHVLMPILSVGACWNQHNHCCPSLRFFPPLPYKSANYSAIRRIAPNNTAPRLLECIILLCVEPFTLGVPWRSSSIQCEPELSVEPVKEVLWCLPPMAVR